MQRARVLIATTLISATLHLALVAPAASAGTGAPGKIAYTTSSGLFTVEPDGSDVRQVGNLTYPTWSPDGSMLMGQKGSGSIAVVDANGLRTTTLFKPAGDRDVYRPTWSPNGKKIALGMSGFAGSNNTEIVIVTLKTQDWVRMTNSSGWDSSPEWSPDGSALAFFSVRNSGRGIYLMDLETGEVTPDPLPYTEYIEEFKWSPDSSTLIWNDEGAGFQTYRVGVDTYPQMIPGTGSYEYTPTYSPDGSRILFNSKRFGNYDLYTMALDGSDWQQLTFSEFTNELYPDWQAIRVALSADLDTIDYGDTVTLEVHLYPYAETTNPEVTLYRSVAGGETIAFQTLDLLASGISMVDLTPQRNTVYSARWAGDDDDPSSISGLVGVKVRAYLAGALRGFYDTSGDYRQYHRGDPVRFIATLLPAQTGKQLEVDLYEKTSHGWRYVTDGLLDTGSDGVIAVGITGLPLGRYRIHGAFNGSKSNLAVVGNFTYAQVTA